MLNQPVGASSVTRAPTVALQDRLKAGGDDSIRQQLLGLWVVVCVEALQTGAGFLETALATVAAMQLLLKSLSLAAWAWYVSGHILETDNTITSGQQPSWARAAPLPLQCKGTDDIPSSFTSSLSSPHLMCVCM